MARAMAGCARGTLPHVSFVEPRFVDENSGTSGDDHPRVVVSPFARRKSVSATVYDHTSVLKLIEWRWGLRSLTVRDQNANNLADLLDISQPNLAAPDFDVPPGPFGGPCPLRAPAHDEDWSDLRALARNYGWPV
jgi:phospholipase C